VTATGATGPVDVVFFDARDTLGEVDHPGHLVPYRPSTERLLWAMRNLVGVRVGVITNLPQEVSADEGRRMIEEAILAEDAGSNGDGPHVVRIGDFLDPAGLIINHEVGFDKPDPRIYEYAARKLGVPIERALYCGENLIEVLGARAAGMQAQLKPNPPGRDFAAEPVKGLAPSTTFSGRAFELVLEHEHLLGHRIFACIDGICDQVRALPPGTEAVPAGLHTAMGILVYLTGNFVDAHHLRAEEAIVPLAVARGMDPSLATWMFDHHDQARAYFGCLDVAWRRVERGDARDLPMALDAYVRSAEGFVRLFEWHGTLEDDELFPAIGRCFSDSDDTLVLNIIGHIGPPDPTPYVSLVAAMEEALAAAATAAPAARAATTPGSSGSAGSASADAPEESVAAATPAGNNREGP
jgi:hemerythrin-like domain-containing protein